MCFSSSACVDKLERAQLFNAAMIVQKTSCPTVQCSIDIVCQKVCNFHANFIVLCGFVRLDENRFLLFVFVYCLLVFGETEGICFYYGGILFLVRSYIRRAGFLQAVRSQCLQSPLVLPIQEINQQLFPTRNGIKDQLQIQAKLLLFLLF